MSKTKVGVIGAGHRITNIYLPVFKALSPHLEVVGFTAPSDQSRKAFEKTSGFPAYTSASELVSQESPHLLIVAVPPELNEQVVADLIDLRVPLAVETPLAWTKRRGEAMIKKAESIGVDLFVMEQMPYLPEEQLKADIVRSGILGPIYAAINDFQTFSYHGIAQLRRYVDGTPISVSCRELRLPLAPKSPSGPQAVWENAQIMFSGGAALTHMYSGHYVDSRIAFPASIRIYGEKGTIAGSTLRLMSNDRSKTYDIQIKRNSRSDGVILNLTVDVADGLTFEWTNPYAAFGLSEEQIAVASLLSSMLSTEQSSFNHAHKPAPYRARDFLTDIEIIQAMRYSSIQNGKTIMLPLNEIKEKIAVALSPSVWKSKFVARAG